MAKTKKLPPPRFHKSCLLAKGRHMWINYHVTVGPAYSKHGYLAIPDDHPWFNLTMGKIGSPYCRPKTKRIQAIVDRLPFRISCAQIRQGYRVIGFSSSFDIYGHEDLPDVALVKREFRERMVRDENGKPQRWKDKGDSEKFREEIHFCLSQYEYPLSCDWKPSPFEDQRPAIISTDRMVKLVKKACKVAHTEAAKW